MDKLQCVIEMYRQVLKLKRVIPLGLILYIISTNVASATAIVTLSMDDGFEGQYYNAYPILYDRNINATVFITTSFIGETGKMTLAQLKELQDAGWEIGSHTMTHPLLTSLNPTQLDYELKGSKDWLEANGFVVKTIAYPNGVYDATVSAEAQKYYTIARTTDESEVEPALDLNITTFDIHAWHSYIHDETVIKSRIDDAITNDLWLNIYFHNVNANGFLDFGANEQNANLTAVADYIKSKVDAGQLKSLTFYQGWLEATKIPPPNPANLLANPGFESGTTNPLNWNLVTVSGNTPVWDSVSHTGAKSIKISISGTKNFQSGYPKSDLIAVSALKNYTLSAWVKTLNAGGTRAPAVRVVELDGNQINIRTTTLFFNQGTNDWTKKQIIFQTTTNTKYLYVYANIASGYGTFWVDDVSISVLDTTIPIINNIGLNTFTPNTGDAILVTVDASDNVAVTGVEANGVSLANHGGNIWTGTITALEGTHSVNISAWDASGNVAWDNSTLYAATTITSPPNQLANPSFESGTTQPLNWNLITVGDNTPIWDTVSHTGARSIKISNPGTTNSQSGYPESGLITAVPLHIYTFSAWVKTLNAGGDSSPTVRVVELDVNKNWIRQTSLYFSRGTNDWTNKQTTFQTAINTKYLYVYANIWNGYGTFWVDDVVLSSSTSDTTTPVINTVTLNTNTPDTGETILVSVEATDNVAVTGVEANGVSLANNGGNTWTGTITAVEGTHSVNVQARDAAGNIAWDNSTLYTATTSASPPNLIANSGFESGSTQPLNWNLVTVGSSTPIWDTVSHTGARSMKISNPGTTNSKSGYPKSDLITAVHLQNYTFSAWVKTLNAGGDSSPAVRVDELDVNMNWIRQTTLYFNQGTNDWTNKQATFQTAINTKYLQVYANIWNGYGTFWVDDVILSVSTPE